MNLPENVNAKYVCYTPYFCRTQLPIQKPSFFWLSAKKITNPKFLPVMPKTRKERMLETLISTKNFVIFNHRNKSSYLTDVSPAHVKQKLSDELVEMMFSQVTLPWIQQFI